MNSTPLLSLDVRVELDMPPMPPLKQDCFSIQVDVRHPECQRIFDWARENLHGNHAMADHEDWEEGKEPARSATLEQVQFYCVEFFFN